MANFDDAIGTILRHEGGFVNDTNDPGGATNYGVSLRWLKSQGLSGDIDHDGDVDIDDIRALNPATAAAFYKTRWWDLYHYGEFISQAIGTKVFDMAVNLGPIQGHRLLQAALGKINGLWVPIDGVLGPKTLGNANSAVPSELMTYLQQTQANFYRSLAASKPELAKFLNGWLNRAYDRA